MLSAPLSGPLPTTIAAVLDRLETVVLGKRRQVELAAACMIAGGHLLIEDRPGTGKTVLAHALAVAFGLEFCRVQFTSDLLPGDLLGTSIYDRASGRFSFRPGPIFTSVLLADEINRAPPKSQSALLEAMEERQVSIDGHTHPLPETFFVIATQNPEEATGTFPLPEAQLDRFLMRIHMGYPDRETELALLGIGDRRPAARRIGAAIDVAGLRILQAQAATIHASPALLAYVWSLLDATRSAAGLRHGLSTRAGLALLRAARAWALLQGEDKVLPGHVQAVLGPVVAHRLGMPDSSVQHLLESVAVG
ncbi:AAA domain-containing protein [Rhodovastum atsumiense]|uniref:AAA domain-containing protein n=1 Tax=Rhodovastum atsumiense TaxID=504468 RepID=A0A5M6IWR5_9PROT|nr:AAA family ATPase [Rhodovastum atsumiense]KAA5612766.1 AAA domain-containing protein [Rhodovastum atsumiense]CAH2602670.1 AAA domain-containing protein [Rhodovastum atsumiense]